MSCPKCVYEKIGSARDGVEGLALISECEGCRSLRLVTMHQQEENRREQEANHLIAERANEIIRKQATDQLIAEGKIFIVNGKARV